MALKTLRDPDAVLAGGLAAIRDQYQVPGGFPPAVEAAAAAAAQRPLDEHADRTALPFVTLDPASATDLDQAFTIEPAGNDLLLRYAIADVAWFVRDSDAVDAEAWRRGATLYLPDGKARLYPAVLSEQAVSLLPDGPRAAIIFAVRVDPDGRASLDGAERAIIRSRAKLAYRTVTDADLPAGFAELATRVQAAEQRRGAARVDPPEQEVAREDGHYRLVFRTRHPSEDRNAALSLAANLAIAEALLARRTGLFRVMAGPGERAVRRLRFTARALGIAWPADQSLGDVERGLDPADPKQAAFMTAIRRAGTGASYLPWQEGVTPWHAALAATYAHATAPLRRLADRYVVQAALAIANGRPVPDTVGDAFTRLPQVMGRADARSGQIERAVIDLAETVMLQERIGEDFEAVVTDQDERGARIQLRDLPVVARVSAHRVEPGETIRVRLTAADPETRRLAFQRMA
ncbi:MAG TPA: RNB domain-containing ribonuclease [Allosphingosinicella sp.]|nr:RNB domain-containing ribonuclease [Allosphingosinicella sp.]